jgi:hypothetical protein
MNISYLECMITIAAMLKFLILQFELAAYIHSNPASLYDSAGNCRVDVVQQLNSIRRSHSIFNTAATPCDIS